MHVGYMRMAKFDTGDEVVGQVNVAVNAGEDHRVRPPITMPGEVMTRPPS